MAPELSAPAARAEALRRWQERRDDASREAALEAHLPLVKRAFARLRVGLPSPAAEQLSPDLCQAGVIGLIQALDGFRAEKGASFETYAAIRIRGAMLDELRRQDWLSKQSRQRLKQLQRAVRDVEQGLGRSASEEEVASHLGLSVEELGRRYVELGPATLVFLEGLGPEEGQGRWAERLADFKAQAPDGLPLAQELRDRLREGIESLPAQERQVLELLVLQELGHKETAEALAVSPSRISQIYSSAVVRLQARLLPLFEGTASPTQQGGVI